MMTQETLTIGGKTARSTLGQHPVTIDWEKMPEASQDFIVRYGLRQYLADAMAGADNEPDAKAKVNARLAKLVSGDLSRTKGEGFAKPDTEEGRAIKLAKTEIRRLMAEQKVEATKEDVAAAAAEMVKTDGAWLKEAKKQIAAEKASAETLKTEDGAALIARLFAKK